MSESRKPITKRQEMTLQEMRRYPAGHYWWRQATCRELVALGLAEPVGEHLKRPAHRITQKGREALGVD